MFSTEGFNSTKSWQIISSEVDSWYWLQSWDSSPSQIICQFTLMALNELGIKLGSKSGNDDISLVSKLTSRSNYTLVTLLKNCTEPTDLLMAKLLRCQQHNLNSRHAAFLVSTVPADL